MSAQFEAEIRNSIQSLNGAVARLSAETQRANSGMRQLSMETRGAAAAVADVGRTGDKTMQTVARGAQKAGGGMGKAFGVAGAALGALNPIAMGVGVGIGFITTEVFKMVEGIQKANAEAERLNSLVNNMSGQRKQADKAIAMRADTERQREQLTLVQPNGLNDDQQAAVKKVLKGDGTYEQAKAAALAATPQGGLGRMLSSEALESIRKSVYDNNVNPDLAGVRHSEKMQGAANFDRVMSERKGQQRAAGINNEFTRPTTQEVVGASPELAQAVKEAADRVTEATNKMAEALKNGPVQVTPVDIYRSNAPTWLGGGIGRSKGMEAYEAQREVDAARTRVNELNSQIERQVARDY